MYRNVYLDRHNDTHLRVAPCCQATTAIEPVDEFDFYTSPYLTRFREKFDQNLRPAECSRCWEVEQTGGKSKRLASIEFYQARQPDRTVALESVDHSSTWACNLACIMCGPRDSSTWANEQQLSKQELAKIGRMFQKKNNFLDKLDLSRLKKIHFNGGEPMLNDDQISLLEKMDEQRVLDQALISYNTNGTVMPSKKIVDLWSRAKLVKIYLSIDATGSAFEYVRWPGKWDQTSRNLLAMKNDFPGNVMFGFNVTVGSYNIMEIKDLYKWFQTNMNHNREGDQSDFCWQLATNFDPAGLPKQVKLTVIDQLKDLEALQGIGAYLKSTINYSEDLSWIQRLEQLDLKRNTDWRQCLKIYELLKEKIC